MYLSLEHFRIRLFHDVNIQPHPPHFQKKKKKKNPTLRFKLNAEMPFHSTRI